jgi:hypothetical protein
MTMRIWWSTFALMTCLSLAVETASAQNFYEPFNTDTATAGTTYSPPFTFTPGTGGTAVVSGGVLFTTNTANVTQTFLRPGFAGSQRVSGSVGASNSNGSYNVGLVTIAQSGSFAFCWELVPS